PNKVQAYDVKYENDEIGGPPVVITPKPPIVNPFDMTTTYTKTGDEIRQDPNRNVIDQAAQSPGSVQKDAGEKISTNGGRTNAGMVVIDGVISYAGTLGLLDTEIELMQVLSSGIPAEYGDVTGSIINIITKGPSGRFTAGAQLET